MKKLAVLWICAALLSVAQILPSAAGADSSATPNGEGTVSVMSDEGLYYGREAISRLENANALLYAYDSIVEGVENSLAKISVFNGTDPISVEELKVVYEAYRRDRPEHFWLGNSYSYFYRGEVVEELVPSYNLSGDALKAARARFDKRVAELLHGITPSMSEYQRELEIHNRLASAIRYDFGDHAYDAYGAIVEGVSVCEGYAESFQYLLRLSGIRAFVITGESKNPSSGKSEGHAWNLVNIDGDWYHVDLTWDDQGERLFYAYFNKTDREICEDHIIDKTVYGLPACNSDKADYYSVSGVTMERFDADAIAGMLKKGNFTARVYITGNVAEFTSLYGEKILDVATKMGVEGRFSYGFAVLGREVILTLTVDGCTHQSKHTVEAKASTCKDRGWESHSVCDNCGRIFYLSGAPASEVPYLPLSDSHVLGERIDEIASTCTSNGVAEHYECEVCHAYLDDENKLLYTLVIPSTGHKYSSDTDTDCDRCGSVRELSTTPSDPQGGSQGGSQSNSPSSSQNDKNLFGCGSSIGTGTGAVYASILSMIAYAMWGSRKTRHADKKRS